MARFDVDGMSLPACVILSCGLQIGILHYLHDNRASMDSLEARFNHYGELIPALVWALVSYGYLEVISEREFALTAAARTVVDGDESVAFLNYDWYFAIADAPRALAKGGHPRVSESTYEGFIDISETLAADILPFVERSFAPMLARPARLLDVGRP